MQDYLRQPGETGNGSAAWTVTRSINVRCGIELNKKRPQQPVQFRPLPVKENEPVTNKEMIATIIGVLKDISEGTDEFQIDVLHKAFCRANVQPARLLRALEYALEKASKSE